MARRKLNITDEDKAEILRLYVTGSGIVEIAKTLTDQGKQLSPSTVARIVRETGGTMRKRGTRNPVVETVVNPLENHAPAIRPLIFDPEHYPEDKAAAQGTPKTFSI